MVYQCFVCGTKCDTHKRYEKHCQTIKHIKKLKPSLETTYECICGKSYVHKPSLIRHHRTCSIKQQSHIMNDDTPYNINSPRETKQKQTRPCFQHYNHVETVNNTINETNITNPVFNFNIYLNEQCRDAICIEEFCNSIVNRIRNIDESNVNISFIDNKETFDHMLGNLMFMNSVKRPIQSFQGEIMEKKSRNDWRTLTLDKLNSHVTGITSQVNWAKFSGLPQPITSNELLQNMMALHAATQIHPPLRYTEMGQLREVTQVNKIKNDDR